MAEPRSVKELDFRPKPGKRYWSCDREWREEFIYFLMVDRFHDDRERRPRGGAGRAAGCGTPEQLRRFCGGTLRGVTRNLSYIQDLGCTALWLSPIFENEGAPDRLDFNRVWPLARRRRLTPPRRVSTRPDAHPDRRR